jgi:hypothetical protein
LENRRAEQVLPGREVGVGGGRQGGRLAQTMYTHMNKCKNDTKIKYKINNNKKTLKKKPQNP